MARIKVFDPSTGKWVYADKSFSRVPIKGVDYFTAADKEEIIQAVILSLSSDGSPIFDYIDEQLGVIENGTY